jgi:hypothetical protein
MHVQEAMELLTFSKVSRLLKAEICYFYSTPGVSDNEAANTAAKESAFHRYLISEWIVGSDVLTLFVLFSLPVKTKNYES